MQPELSIHSRYHTTSEAIGELIQSFVQDNWRDCDYRLGDSFDKMDGGSIIQVLINKPRWRNWHTQQVEGLCPQGRESSSLSRGMMSS